MSRSRRTHLSCHFSRHTLLEVDSMCEFPALLESAIRYASCVLYLFLFFDLRFRIRNDTATALPKNVHCIWNRGEAVLPLGAPPPTDYNTMWISSPELWSNLEKMHLRRRRRWEEKESLDVDRHPVEFWRMERKKGSWGRTRCSERIFEIGASAVEFIVRRVAFCCVCMCIYVSLSPF